MRLGPPLTLKDELDVDRVPYWRSVGPYARPEFQCEKHIARYKLPKDIVFVDEVQRSPSGKADYRWAREQAVAAAESPA